MLRVSEATATTPRQYFIHYQGWNAKWDKWVDADLLLKVRRSVDKWVGLCMHMCVGNVHPHE